MKPRNRVILICFSVGVVLIQIALAGVFIVIGPEFLSSRDSLEILPPGTASERLSSMLWQYWKIGGTVPADDMQGAVVIPGGLGQGLDTACFSFKNPQPDELVQSFVLAAEKNPEIQDVTDVPAAMMDSLTPRQNVPGWWIYGSPPSDLQAFKIKRHGCILYVGYSIQLGTVYFEPNW